MAKQAKRAPKRRNFPDDMWMPLAEAKPYPQNPKVITTAAINKVAALIRKFGPTQPIAKDENGEILIGHTRRLAALQEGYTEWPQVVLTGLSDNEKRALRIADNRVGEEAVWDFPKLKIELSDLRLGGFDIGVTGFEKTELFNIFGPVSANNAGAEWAGMPEFDQQDKTAHRSLVINFKSDEDVAAFAKKIKQNITPKTRSLWFPKAEIETLADKRYGQQPKK